MPCYYPLTAYYGGKTPSGKKSVVFKKPPGPNPDGLQLPCGRCIGCRLERSRQWAVRCMHEASLWEDNCFITLTYNDQNLPPSESLHLPHFQMFMKRLRKHYTGKKIRFYHCGEYAEREKPGGLYMDLIGRPHYHALLFNLDFPDKTYWKTENGNKLYISDTLTKLWGMGHCLIGSLTFESAAYVARYVLKKKTGPPAPDHYKGRDPEYTTMSRRKGIGLKWLEKFHTDVYPHDFVIVRGNKSKPPRFYDKFLESSDPDMLENLKLARSKRADKTYMLNVRGKKIAVSDNSPRRLAVKEQVKLAQIKNLKRNLK